jgi:hypothetical protein
MGDIGRVVSIATGDLRQRVEKQYPGVFGAWRTMPTAPPSS